MPGKPRQRVQSFQLYGDPVPGHAPGRLHIEDIQSRSRRYHWEITAHVHERLYQCLFLESGPAEVSVDGARSSLKGPAAVLLPPGTVHAFRFDASTDGMVLTLDPEVLLRSADSAAQAAVRSLFAVPHLIGLAENLSLAQRLARLLACLHEEFRRPEAVQAPLCLWLAQCVLWLLTQELRAHHGTAAPTQALQQQLLRFRELLEQRYMAHWNVPRYARALGLTARRLNRLTQRHLGLTAHAAIQERLLLEARRRLTYVAMPVNQIALELGFDDPAYFCRFFRRHTGMSPRAFRMR